MPFTGPGDPELPDRIKGMSLAKRKRWVGAWNGSFADCQKKGAGDCEGSAFRVANAAIKEIDMDEVKDDEGLTADEVKAVEDEKRLHEEESMLTWHPAFGAQSWQELTDSEEAQEKVFQVMDITHNFKGIMMNIMDDPHLDPDQKADLLDAAVRGLRPMMAAVKELETVEGTKQATKTEDGIAFRARDFAVVPDAEKPGGWKLRLAEGSSGNVTRAQIARAITAMQPGGFRGNKVVLGPGDKAQAIRRISAAINRASGTDDQKKALRDRLNKVKEGPLQKATGRAIEVLGKWLKGQKADPATSGLTVFKDAAGAYRWLATVTNRWRDRDNPPEIFEEKAHKDFVKYLDGGGFMPELWLWHTPGTSIGKADWVSYDGGFLLASGIFNKGFEAVAERLSERKGLGISHGYKYTYSDPTRGIIGQYRSFEISVLPHERAANAFTGFDILSKEATMEITPAKRTFLVEALGEEKVAALEKEHTTMASVLDAAGIDSKDLPEEKVKDDDGAEPKIEDATKALETVVAAVKEMSEGFKGLTESVGGIATEMKAMKERLDNLEKSDDEKISAALTAKVKTGATNGHRASESGKNTVSEEEAKKDEPSLPKDVISPKFMDSIKVGDTGAPTGGA